MGKKILSLGNCFIQYVETYFKCQRLLGCHAQIHRKPCLTALELIHSIVVCSLLLTLTAYFVYEQHLNNLISFAYFIECFTFIVSATASWAYWKLFEQLKTHVSSVEHRLVSLGWVCKYGHPPTFRVSIMVACVILCFIFQVWHNKETLNKYILMITVECLLASMLIINTFGVLILLHAAVILLDSTQSSLQRIKKLVEYQQGLEILCLTQENICHLSRTINTYLSANILSLVTSGFVKVVSNTYFLFNNQNPQHQVKYIIWIIFNLLILDSISSLSVTLTSKVRRTISICTYTSLKHYKIWGNEISSQIHHET